MANPFGPPALGWAAVEARLEQAASSLRGAGGLTFDRVAFVEASELAYTVEFEHYRDQFIVGSDEAHLIDLRVTTVFRRDDGAWPMCIGTPTRS